MVKTKVSSGISLAAFFAKACLFATLLSLADADADASNTTSSSSNNSSSTSTTSSPTTTTTTTTTPASGVEDNGPQIMNSNEENDEENLFYDIRPFRLYPETTDHLEVSDLPQVLAMQVCAGFFNRRDDDYDNVNSAISGTYAFGIWDQDDLNWLKEIEGVEQPALTEPDVFLTKCLTATGNGVQGRYIRYNYETQQEIVPNLLTLAAVLNAVPMDDINNNHTRQLLQEANATMVLNAQEQFAGYSAYDATRYMFDHYASQTTTMAKMNPGYPFWKEHSDIHPQITEQPDVRSADYVIKEKLFNFFLLNGCLPYTQDHALMTTMTQHGHPNTTQWPQPIVVMGYDDFAIKEIPGDLFEAETTCVKEHNLGQVATKWMTNMAFWSRKPPITAPLTVTNPTTKEVYNASTTYVAFIIGDGDNIGMVRYRNLEWVYQRQDKCKNESLPHPCFPISWSVSPHASYLTPDMLQWYYAHAQETGQDYFVLPPSGYLYAYPSLMHEEDQKSYVSHTEEAAQLLNSSGTVDWEFALTWRGAISDYFPKFAEKEIIRGIFAVNVPFNFPVFSFGRHEYFKIIKSSSGNGATVLFRPREWRGTSGSAIPFAGKEALTEEEMAAEINGQPPGTVSYIYLTSDGGANLESLYNMVPYLEEHVKVVSHEVLIDMALQKNKDFPYNDVNDNQLVQMMIIIFASILIFFCFCCC